MSQREIIGGGRWGWSKIHLKSSSLAEIELPSCSDSIESSSQKGRRVSEGRDSESEGRFPISESQQQVKNVFHSEAT